MRSGPTVQTVETALRALTRRILVGVVYEGRSYVALGHEAYYAAQGEDVIDALRAWADGYVASVVLQVERGAVGFEPTPGEVWAEHARQSGAHVYLFSYGCAFVREHARE